MPINKLQLTERDFAPKITLHNLEAEAKYVAQRLNQNPTVIEYILRDYWKDKVAVEIPLQQKEVGCNCRCNDAYLVYT